MADVVESGPSSKVRATWWPNWVVSFGVARLGEASCAVTVLHASSLLVSGFVAESRPLWTRDDSDRFELLACCALCEWERSLQEKGDAPRVRRTNEITMSARVGGRRYRGPRSAHLRALSGRLTRGITITNLLRNIHVLVLRGTGLPSIPTTSTRPPDRPISSGSRVPVRCCRGPVLFPACIGPATRSPKQDVRQLPIATSQSLPAR